MALPVVDTKDPQVKELISSGVKDIANMIFKSASVSITAAAKAVTPSIPAMVADITEDLRSGPVNRFSQGLEKLDKLLQNFGNEVKDYSKDLAKFISQREARVNKSEKIIRELRENNVKAEMNSMGEINILSKFQIQQKEKDLKLAEEAIAKEKANIEVKTKLVQDEKGNTKERRESIVKSQETIIQKEKERADLLEVLNKNEEDTSDEAQMTIRERASNFVDEYVPDGLRDIGSQFMEGLMAPITAVKELGFFFGGLLKPLKLLPKLFKGFIGGMIGAIASLLPFIAIALAITVAIVAVTVGLMKLMQVIEENKEAIREFGMRILEAPGKIIKGIGDFMSEKFEQLSIAFDNFIEGVKAIPGRIKTFFKNMFVRIKNFFIDMINGAIELINKVPGIEMDKLEKAPLVGENESDSPVVTGEGSPTIQAAQSGTLTTENKLPFLNTNNNQNNNSNAAVAVNNTNIANNTTLGSFASSKNNDMSRMSLYSDMSP